MKIKHKVAAGLAGSILLLALISTLSFWAFHQFELAVEAQEQTDVVINTAGDLLSALKDAETAQRGFLLTGDETFLQPYWAVKDSFGDELKKLRQFPLSSLAKQHLDAMAPLIEAKLALVSQGIQLRRNHDMSAVIAFTKTGRGQRLMDEVRVEMGRFIQIEKAALVQQQAVFKSNMNDLFDAIIFVFLLLLVVVLAFAYWIYRETQRRLENLVHIETQNLLKIQAALNQKLQHTNAALQISEEKLSVTLNSIGDAVIATDVESRVTFMNPVAEQLTGWTIAEAANRSVSEVFNVISQDTRLPAIVPVGETLAFHNIQGLANHTILLARNGGECAIADSCAPIRNRDSASDHEVTGTVLVFRDISKEHSAQQALRDSSALIHTILNTVVDGIITIHASNGTIETFNPAAERLFGYRANELIGQNFNLLIPNHDYDNMHAQFTASEVASVMGMARECQGKHKDGTIFPIEIVVGEMWMDGQRYFTGIMRDISTRKQAEEALLQSNIDLKSAKSEAEKANLAKSEFISSMSHELRTPLTAILGFAQLLETTKPPLSHTQILKVQQITKAGWYLLELINEILDLAVIESGKLSLSLETLSLQEVMRECEAMIDSQAQQRDIRIKFCSFDPTWFIFADRTRVKQVLINLLTNAIKYNRAQGTIEVSCSDSTPERIRINVKDSGAGLAAEQLAQLFQPFNRLGQESGVEEGTGIGLALSKQLVKQMGGTVGVDSEVGVGSNFWIELVRDVASSGVAKDAHQLALAPLIQGSAVWRTLLYVEDNPANLALVEQIIAEHPYVRLLSAATGEIGIALARTHHPDVILMDISLPGMSGMEALSILRADPLTMHIPVIALSANAMARDIEKGLEAGFFRYLTKPIRINEFTNALRTAMKSSESELAVF
jgi:PAS domain S-box-containing protein